MMRAVILPGGLSVMLPAPLVVPEYVEEAPTAFTVVRDEGPKPPPRFAPNDPAGIWPAAALPVTFVLGAPASRDVGAEAAKELDVAIRTWPRVACTAWRAAYGGETTTLAADDGVNVVLFHDAAWPPE